MLCTCKRCIRTGVNDLSGLYTPSEPRHAALLGHTKAAGSLIGVVHPFWPRRPGSPGSDEASPYHNLCKPFFPTILNSGTTDVPCGAVECPPPHEYPIDTRLSNHPPKRTAAGSFSSKAYGAEVGNRCPATFGGLCGC